MSDQHSPTDLTNWISLSECAARLPSTHAGRHTKSDTVLRLARKHGLRVLRRDNFYFVYWPDILSTFKPERTAAPRPQRHGRRRTLAQIEETKRILKEHGCI